VCLAPYSLADIIVLKNGRRIVASNVKEAGEKISGETSAGSITVPASIVDHIEREAGGVSPVETLRLSRPQTANNPSASAQTTEDPAFLQQAGREAASGDAAAAARAAQLEAAAGGAEFARGNMDEALRHAERALGYEPESLALLLDAAYIRLRRAEYGPALDYLQRARKVAPDSVEVAKLAGWAYYGQNRLAPAVEEWRRAQKIQPDDEVAAALAKAERDLEAEREFREDGSEHFVLKYSGTAAPELARAILRQLEADFLSISATLNYDPSERIGVLLYTNQAFADITHAPSWVGALNDGRIRIPVQGLTSVTPELARVLRHELAHSIVGGKTRGRCPVWLQEGVAQWMDGSELSPGGAAKLLALFDRHQDPSLLLLEGSWMKFDQGFAGNAYGWSLAVVQSVARAGGPTDIARLLEYVAVESDTETAVRSSLHLDYSGLAAFAADDLRKNYGH
jgi:hypothetical protein